MQFDVLQYGYLGIVALILFFSFKIIADFQDSKKPFYEGLVLLIMFLIISIGCGGVGYLWASKELEIAEKRESTLSIAKDQITASRNKLTLNTFKLREALEANLKEVNSTILGEKDRNAALKRVESISTLLKQREEAYQNELKLINQSLAAP